MTFSLTRGTPFVLNGYCHVVVDGEQLCREPVYQPVTWNRVEVTAVRDVCSNCLRRLLARLGVADETEENALRAIRGDYSASNPNSFWRAYGLTDWSTTV